MLNWKDVIKFASHGNREPDRRVEKTEEEWKELLECTLSYPKKNKISATFCALCSIYDAGK